MNRFPGGHPPGHRECLEAFVSEVLRGLAAAVAVTADHRDRLRAIEMQRLERREPVDLRGRDGAEIEGRPKCHTHLGYTLGGPDVGELHALAAAGPEGEGFGAAFGEGRRRPAVVEVKMTGDGTSKAAFEPATLTVKTGSVVRFINVSGGPHDIAFYTDSVPKGAVDALKKGMANTMGDLVGPFLTQPNEHYDVSFAGAPAGKYRGYCLPHVALGMHITITVQ